MNNKFDPGAQVALSDFLKKAELSLKRVKPKFLKPAEPALVRAQHRAATRRYAARKRAAKVAARWRPKPKRPPWRLAHLVALSIEPGHWYGAPDIARLCRRPTRPTQIIIRRMVRDGEMEKWTDPEWRPRVYRKGVGVDVQGRDRPCRYLWRLTRRGEELRREAMLLD